MELLIKSQPGATAEQLCAAASGEGAVLWSCGPGDSVVGSWGWGRVRCSLLSLQVVSTWALSFQTAHTASSLEGACLNVTALHP